jgi:hypothetical protein
MSLLCIRNWFIQIYKKPPKNKNLAVFEPKVKKVTLNCLNLVFILKLISVWALRLSEPVNFDEHGDGFTQKYLIKPLKMTGKDSSDINIDKIYWGSVNYNTRGWLLT